MKTRFALAVMATISPAAAFAAPNYDSVLAQANADPVQAAYLYHAFCIKGLNTTPKWICDQIRAAERPVQKPGTATLKMK